MKHFIKTAIIAAIITNPATAQDREDNTVLLNETGAENLGIKTVMTEERDFEETIFAIGRIEVYPGYRAAISSRIPGRALEVLIKHDHPIEKGDVAVIVESRQPGNPPPTVELTAPISGLISATHIVTGEPVSPDKILAEIINLSKVYALARVPEQMAGKIKPGLLAHIQIPAVPGKIFEAKLEHLGALADPGSGTVEAAFVIQNPESKLRPGMRAEFDIVVNTRPNVLAVPEEAIQGDTANPVVYVKDFELPNAFIRAPVIIGETGAGMVEIKQGLFPGDEVVTRGSYSLGFVGNDSGLSLKEALDAAHGHEHAADGSELEGGEETHDDHEGHDHGEHAGEAGHDDHHIPTWMLIYAALTSALALAFAQLFWNAKRRNRNTHTA